MERLRPIAAQYDLTLAQLALAWLLQREGVSSVIIGATRAAQIEENVAATGQTLAREDMARIDELFPAAQFQ